MNLSKQIYWSQKKLNLSLEAKRREAARFLGFSYSPVVKRKDPIELPNKKYEDLVSLDTYWYSDDEINSLLNYFFGSRKDIHLTDAINAFQHSGETLGESLKDIEEKQAIKKSLSEVMQNTIVMPVNLGNRHWAALYIHFSSEDRTKPTIGYFDPFGSPMPDILEKTLKDVYQINKEDMIDSPIELQRDKYNCGPWIIAILDNLVNNGKLPPESFDIDLARQTQQEILRNLKNVSKYAGLKL